ncbi:MAG: TRAP transporter small permease subunit [Burkholderiaceae bacterium]
MPGPAQVYLRVSAAVIEWVAAAVLISMVAINGAEILYRVLFTRGLNWVQELSLVLAMVLYFLTYALIAKNREYIRIELFSTMLSAAGRRAFSMLVRLVVLAFHACIAWYAARTVQFAAMFELPILGWGEWVYYLPLTLGCADIVITESIFLAWQLRGLDIENERAEALT